MPTPIRDDVLNELKATHGGALHLLEHQGYQVVVTSPNRNQYKRWRAQIADERKRIDAIENLVKDCVVYPDKAGLEAMFDERPALTLTFGSSLLEIAGAASEAEKKAL